MHSIDIPYYRGNVKLNVQGVNLKAVLEPAEGIAQVMPAGVLVRDALEKPIGTNRLRELAEGRGKVVIVTSDHTRPMPSRVTMPLLLAEIRETNAEAEITILVATGLHRKTTDAELLERFGETIFHAEKIVVHNANTDECVNMGVLPSGNAYAVNRLVTEADLLICEGFIEPHFFAGFSGGRKSILPGVCSAETIRAIHSAGIIADENSMAGVLRHNIIHSDATYAARQVGVDFILNVAMDTKKRVVAAYAGDLEEAHLQGCALVKQLFTIPQVKADIVITSNGGYPLDQNLYQCAKAASTAAPCANEGGIVIIVASCCDGVGGAEFQCLMLEGDPATTLGKIMSLPVKETIYEQWNAQVLLEVMLRHKVILVTQHFDHDIVRAMGLTPASSVDAALSIARLDKGVNASVVVIPDGVSVMVEDVRP